MSVKFRAGVIGRTGRGDYGHLLDTVYADTPNVDCVAVADDDEQQFWWARADEIKRFPGTTMPAHQTLRRAHPGMLVQKRVNY